MEVGGRGSIINSVVDGDEHAVFRSSTPYDDETFAFLIILCVLTKRSVSIFLLSVLTSSLTNRH
jgi:hypothetical protein